MKMRTFADIGVPYVPNSPFLDIKHVVDVVRTHFSQLLTILHETDETTGEMRTVLERVCEKPVRFDLAFANRLTYRAGDATVGWISDLEPLFALYRSIVQHGLRLYSLRKTVQSNV